MNGTVSKCRRGEDGRRKNLRTNTGRGRLPHRLHSTEEMFGNNSQRVGSRHRLAGITPFLACAAETRAVIPAQAADWLVKPSPRSNQWFSACTAIPCAGLSWLRGNSIVGWSGLTTLATSAGRAWLQEPLRTDGIRAGTRAEYRGRAPSCRNPTPQIDPLSSGAQARKRSRFRDHLERLQDQAFHILK